MKQLLFFLLFILHVTKGDMYIQAMRGSNNRLDEANRERNNANRLFDSQNNDRGGYNVGKLNVFTGEELPFSWTNQHGCNGDGTQDCEVIMQMMCDPIMRDGTTTSTIPTNPANCRNFNCDLDVKYGRHESYEYYETCTETERNQGLFTASQNLKGNRAKNTRQNPGGTRRGYECPEERDYYPYWRSSPWVDVAIWTKSIERCQEYRAESQNVKSRWHCEVPYNVRKNNQYKNQGIPITEEKCVSWEVETTYPNGTVRQETAAWVEDPAHGYDPPACLTAEASRENHLGLIGHNRQWSWQFELPDFFKADEADVDQKQCAFRLRYNITQDYAAWESPTSVHSGVAAAESAQNAKDAATQPSELKIWEKYGLTRADQETCFTTNNRNAQERKEKCREYVFLNNPRPDPFGLELDIGNGQKFRLKFQLAINTAQYGRTFQDRTHMMTINRRPANIPDDVAIKMVTVGGKRGNIVQTFPAHEYFYYPERVQATLGDYLHFEWTGSNTNPNNNDGQGKQGTDRSNIVPMHQKHYAGGDNDGQGENDVDGIGSLGTNYPAYVQQPTEYSIPDVGTVIVDGEEVHCKEPNSVVEPIAGIPQEFANQLAAGRQVHSEGIDFGNMEELDDAGTSFNLQPLEAKKTGCWHYMGTRNNNFSNRSQKGTICVTSGAYKMEDVGQGQSTLWTKYGWLNFSPDSMSTIQEIRFTTQATEGASQMVEVYPIDIHLNDGKKAELGIMYESRALRKPKFYHKNDPNGDWEEISGAEFTEQNGDSVGIAGVDEGGWYKIEDEVDGGAVAAIVVAGLVFFGAIGYISYKKWYAPQKKDEHSIQYNPSTAYDQA